MFTPTVKRGKMQSMELDDEDVLDMATPIPIPVKDRPRFPYGLRICLTHKELEKLGLEADCEIGDMIHIKAMGRVTSKNESENEDTSGAAEYNCRIEIQIESMALEDETLE